MDDRSLQNFKNISSYFPEYNEIIKSFLNEIQLNLDYLIELNNNDPKLIYNPNKEQKKICMKIINFFEIFLDNEILKTFPSKDHIADIIMLKKNKQV